ncbi:MAG: head GIN domain-containing protein [Lentimicrobiaceae bacterium]
MRSKIYFPILALALLLTSCEGDLFDRVKGTGPVIPENRYVSSFNNVSVNLPADVFISQGDDESVIIEAQENVLDVIRTEVRNNELNVKFEKGVIVKHFEPIKVYITSSHVNLLQLSGSGNIYNLTPINTNDLDVRISGSGEIDLMDIDSPVVHANISGSGNISFSGYCGDQYHEISGSGNIYAFQLLSETADIQINGSGRSEVTVTDYLDANISGSGNIYYKGNPLINSHISGSGGIYSEP